MGDHRIIGNAGAFGKHWHFADIALLPGFHCTAALVQGNAATSAVVMPALLGTLHACLPVSAKEAALLGWLQASIVDADRELRCLQLLGSEHAEYRWPLDSSSNYNSRSSSSSSSGSCIIDGDLLRQFCAMPPALQFAFIVQHCGSGGGCDAAAAAAAADKFAAAAACLGAIIKRSKLQ
jgi:hypothetical protein